MNDSVATSTANTRKRGRSNFHRIAASTGVAKKCVRYTHQATTSYQTTWPCQRWCWSHTVGVQPPNSQRSTCELGQVVHGEQRARPCPRSES